MIDYRNIIRNRELRLKLINLPDESYLKMVYYVPCWRLLAYGLC